MDTTSLMRCTDDDGFTDITSAFHGSATANKSDAIDEAQERADANGAPVAVWERDGWHHVCEVPPDMISPPPETLGWSVLAVVDPMEWA